MKALHVDAGDYVLVDAFMSLLEDNEHRVESALDELIKLRLIVVLRCTPRFPYDDVLFHTQSIF
jgi:hypothetical protein